MLLFTLKRKGIAMIEVLLLSIVLLLIGVAGFGIKMFFDRKAEFKGGSCASSSPELEKQGISCGCEGSCASTGSSIKQ